MKKLLFSFLLLFLLSACSKEENIDTVEDKGEVLSIQDVKIPDVIFTSEKRNSEIDEEEIKLSIQTYLDSFEELSIAIEPFQDYIDEEEEFTTEELNKLSKISKLTKENDENFSNYILTNTLPEGYEEETKRISQYIQSYNAFISELDDNITNFTDNITNGVLPKVNIGSMVTKMKIVNGKEQQKIEEFLEKKNIETKAFGREN